MNEKSTLKKALLIISALLFVFTLTYFYLTETNIIGKIVQRSLESRHEKAHIKLDEKARSDDPWDKETMLTLNESLSVMKDNEIKNSPIYAPWVELLEERVEKILNPPTPKPSFNTKKGGLLIGLALGVFTIWIIGKSGKKDQYKDDGENMSFESITDSPRASNPRAVKKEFIS